MQTRRDQDNRTVAKAAVLRKLLGYARPYARQFLALLLIMLTYAGLDAAMPLLTRAAIDRFAVGDDMRGFGWFALVCFLFALGRGLTVRGMIATSGIIYTGLGHDIRRDCFNHLQKLSFSFFDQRAVGWLMARLTSDTQELSRTFAWGLADLIDGLGKLIMMSIIMFVLDPLLALIVLAVVPPLAIMIVIYQAVTLRLFREVRRANSEVTGAFNEGVSGARTTKTLVREDAALEEFSQRTAHLRDLSIWAARKSALYFPAVLLLGTIGSALALWAGGSGVIADRVTYGTLVAFIAYAVSFFRPLEDIARRFPQLQSAQAGAERIFSVLETEPEIRDCGTDPDAPPTEARPLKNFDGGVEFRNVDFAYSPEEPVLRDFSLRARAGETLALVGETGVGKTTIVSLLCRFYEPDRGAILAQGVDYRSLPLAEWRSQLGIVLQDPHLFSGSIRDNIRYGRLDATDREIEDAARVANAHDFIMECHSGYDFQVGENGAHLSAGQKQLIALARVVLADPKILILDEATSAVDTETEALLQSALDRVLQDRTSFVIAHRLSTIRRADRILLLNAEGLAEQGSHRELIRRRGAYYRLYSSQFIEERETALLAKSEQ